MKSFVRLTDFSKEELQEIFLIADNIGEYKNFLRGKTVVLFFPSSSLRTRVSFEKGIHLLGGQAILFEPSTLEKKEDIRDVCGYLQNWADAVVVRHKNIGLLEKMARSLDVPVINAMTDENHPCEMMSDLYSLSKLRADYLQCKYLFVGASGNIGKAWAEAAAAFGFSLWQCASEKYRIEGVENIPDIQSAILGKDIVCTDSIPTELKADFRDYQITAQLMQKANKGALLNPCPSFFRGEEVAADAINSPFFVGYEFKKSLLAVQQAILIYCMSNIKSENGEIER